MRTCFSVLKFSVKIYGLRFKKLRVLQLMKSNSKFVKCFFKNLLTGCSVGYKTTPEISVMYPHNYSLLKYSINGHMVRFVSSGTYFECESFLGTSIVLCLVY